MAEELKLEQKEIQEGKVYGILAYLGILCLVPLLIKKENRFALFHAKQGLVLFICEIGVWIIGFLPFIGPIIGLLGFLTFGIISLIGIIQALTGNLWKVPVICDIAEKITI